MCYVHMNFDVKTDNKVPPCMWFSSERFPDPSIKCRSENECTLLKQWLRRSLSGLVVPP